MLQKILKYKYDSVLGTMVYLGGVFKDFFYFDPEPWGNDPNLTNIFQMGWNHQLGKGLLFELLIASSAWPFDLQNISFGVMARNSQLFLGCLCYMESKGPTLPMPSPLRNKTSRDNKWLIIMVNNPLRRPHDHWVVPLVQHAPANQRHPATRGLDSNCVPSQPPPEFALWGGFFV